MIDTVVLTLNMQQFNVPEKLYDAFSPSAKGVLKPPYYSLGGKKFMKCVLNPSSSDKKAGVYMPRLTLYMAVRNSGMATFLHVEFSAPKILFNNNFDELTDDDFDGLCVKLAEKLRQIGVLIIAPFIKQADVKTIHYSKNIVLTDYTTASSVLSDIAKSNITTRKEADVRAYKNSGEALHFFNTSQGLAIYDKIKELNKSRRTEKGLLEKDNYCQLSLLEDYQPRKPFEVVRIEARYNNRPAIKGILKKIGNETDGLVFRDLYSSDIAKRVLEYEFGQIKSGDMSFNRSNAKTLEGFTNDILASNPKSTVTQRLKAIAMKALFDETGSRDIRKLIGANSSQWSRLVEDMSHIRFRQKLNNSYDMIDRELKQFSPVNVKNHVDEMKGVDI
jgi:hypothetical protein